MRTRAGLSKPLVKGQRPKGHRLTVRTENRNGNRTAAAPQFPPAAVPQPVLLIFFFLFFFFARYLVSSKKAIFKAWMSTSVCALASMATSPPRVT